jgi:hypothetical protein
VTVHNIDGTSDDVEESGNPEPGHPITRVPPDRAMLSLRSFHIVFISLSVVLSAGTGVWALANHQLLLGELSLVTALLLVVYSNYFLRKVSERPLRVMRMSAMILKP